MKRGEIIGAIILGLLAGFLLCVGIFNPGNCLGQSLPPAIKNLPPHQLTCDPLEPGAAALYVYWRGKGATSFKPGNRIPVTVDAAHNPPVFDLLSLNLVCGDYEFGATAFYGAANQESDFAAQIVPYTFIYPWCPKVPASQETIVDHLRRIDAQVRAILLGMVPAQ